MLLKMKLKIIKMKNYLMKLTCLFMFLGLGLATVQASEIETVNTILTQDTSVVGTFEKYDKEGGFKFILEDGKEMSFHKVSPEILRKVNLKSETLKGKKFKVTYTTAKAKTGDVHTIVGVKELKKAK